MEMMVALLIGAIIIAPLYIVTRGMAQETTKQQMETEAIQRARVGMETLITDFQRAGMLASPNPSINPDSIISTNGVDFQQAYNRMAVVHLNRNDPTIPDAVILVGSFFGTDIYQAMLAGNTLTFSQPMATREECQNQVKPNYAFAHLFTTTGQNLDSKVASATCDADVDCNCTVTLQAGELFVNGPGAFTNGQVINVAANQAVLYRVESAAEAGGATRNVLMRYLMDYSNNSGLTNTCVEADISDDMLFLPSARIIADYVEEFEVWFRPVYRNTPADTHEAPKPVAHTLNNLASVDLPFAPDKEHSVVGMADPDSAGVQMSWLTCAPVANTMGPEHVRSAIIRIGVRTEKTDQSMKIIEPGSANPAGDWAALSSISQYNTWPPPAGDVGAYKLRTLITEVAMPNLASKMASVSQVPILN
jgi:hypothetical protein